MSYGGEFFYPNDSFLLPPSGLSSSTQSAPRIADEVENATPSDMEVRQDNWNLESLLNMVPRVYPCTCTFFRRPPRPEVKTLQEVCCRKIVRALTRPTTGTVFQLPLPTPLLEILHVYLGREYSGQPLCPVYGEFCPSLLRVPVWERCRSPSRRSWQFRRLEKSSRSDLLKRSISKNRGNSTFVTIQCKKAVPDHPGKEAWSITFPFINQTRYQIDCVIY